MTQTARETPDHPPVVRCIARCAHCGWTYDDGALSLAEQWQAPSKARLHCTESGHTVAVEMGVILTSHSVAPVPKTG